MRSVTPIEFAKRVIQDGLTPIPVFKGGKRPALDEYSEWHKNRPSADVALSFIRDSLDIGLLCGEICVIDLDTKNADWDLHTEFQDAVFEEDKTLLSRLYFEFTPSGGMHYAFRVNGLFEPPSACLSYGWVVAESKFKPTIDLLSRGRYVKCWPSEGYSTEYDITQAPELSEKEINILIRAAMSTNKRPIEEYNSKDYQLTKAHKSDTKIGDRYAAQATVADFVELLTRNGYGYIKGTGKRITFSRPGAKNATSVDADINVESMTFLPYSTSITDFQQRPYGIFATYAILEHGGDFKEAAKKLSDTYGDKLQSITTPQRKLTEVPIPFQEEAEVDEFALMVEEAQEWAHFDNEHRLRKDCPPKNMEAVWEIYDGLTYSPHFISARGMLNVLSGPEKSWKTAFLANTIASATTGEIVGNQMFKLQEGECVLQIDTEQPQYYAYKNYIRNLTISEKADDAENYYMYQLRSMSPHGRKAAITRLVARHNPSLLIIDGIKDVMVDINDNKEADSILQWLMSLSAANNCTVIVVLHRNKGDDKLRGHIGAELLNKMDNLITMNPVSDSDNLVDVANPKSRSLKFPPMQFKAVTKLNILIEESLPIPMQWRKYANDHE